MKTTNLLKPTAEVVRITHLEPGNVYKRLESTYSGETEIKFGIVQDVLHNGESVAITALEYAPAYRAADVKLKVFGGNADLAIFSATPAEIAVHFEAVQAALADGIKATRDELAKKEAALEALAVSMDRAREGELSAPSTEIVAGEVSA